MDKEKILESARKNKARGKEYEQKISSKSSVLGGGVSLLAGVMLFVVEFLVQKTFNVGFLAIGITGSGAQYLYTGIKTKSAPWIVIGIFQSIMSILLILVFIAQVVSV